MANNVQGPKISFTEAGSINLNCPIKRLIMLAGNAQSVTIDGGELYLGVGREISFNSLNGYPGANISISDISVGTVSFLIEEIGDVLNPNYFKEDIRNWNGQGKTSSVSEVSKSRSRAKKEEVPE